MTSPSTMPTKARPAGWSRKAGLALTALLALFLLADAAMKLMQLPVVTDTMRDIGWPASSVVPLGVILLAATVLYLIPRTALLGALLLTAYLGGAVAAHARIGDPLFTHTLFGVYVGVLLWAALLLRRPDLLGEFGIRIGNRAE